MTLIIKELIIIRGIVTKDSSGLSDETIDKEELYQYIR
jgi:hypothetical protein